MSFSTSLFDVRCTWNSVDGKHVSQAVSWSDQDKSLDIEDTVQAENCLLLEGSEECRLHLSCPSNSSSIKQLVLLSEARLVEVFGDHGEYLQTVRSEVVDQVEDMIVYRSDMDFRPPVNECIIKFGALRDKTKMWLYGASVQVQKTHASSNLLTHILQNASPKQTQKKRVDCGCQTELMLVEKEIQTADIDQPRWEPPEDIVERLSENMECCLEQMELRLWTKFQQRLSEVEQRILLHIGQIANALDEEEDGEEESSQEAEAAI